VQLANQVPTTITNKNGFIEVTNDVLEVPRAGRVAIQLDAHHAFSDIVDNYAGLAQTVPVNNGTKYVLRGSLNGRNGVFEWIIDDSTGAFPGQVSHRFFRIGTP